MTKGGRGDCELDTTAAWLSLGGHSVTVNSPVLVLAQGPYRPCLVLPTGAGVADGHGCSVDSLN